MNDDLPVADLLQATATQMRADFGKTEVVDHPGERGRGREDTVRNFLRDYLPGRFGVDTGFVLDANGQMSAQLDVVIFDQASAPVFRVSDSVRLFPIESVAGVIQVKSFLGRRELEAAATNLATVSTLNRTAGGLAYTMAGGVMQPEMSVPEGELGVGEILDTQGYLVDSEPVLTSIFAFDSVGLSGIAQQVKELLADPVCRIPLVCVLDRGVVSWELNGQLAPYNAYWQDARLAFTTEEDTGRSLQLFYGMLAYGVVRKTPIAPSYRAYVSPHPMELQFPD